MNRLPTAAIVTVGTELTAGLRPDTNGQEIARALASAGYEVAVLTSLPDDRPAVAEVLRGLFGSHAIVVVTGGLGPTHDDITREAASEALSRPLRRDASLVERLERLGLHHRLGDARSQMLKQADVLEGAEVLPAVTGSAPGQVLEADGHTLILLPGPPHEMRPLLESALRGREGGRAPVRLRCAGISESDAQHTVQPALEGYGVSLTLLAGPDDLEVVLFAHPGREPDQQAAAEAAKSALGDACYSDDGSSLAEVVLRLASAAGERIACAESCTGGMLASALTDIAGSSDAFLGSAVTYSNSAKAALLGVPEAVMEQHGAVSEQTARAMAEGALEAFGATLAVSTTGIAGPGGGSTDKPVGLVWFGLARSDGETHAVRKQLSGDRDAIRRRATAVALDLLRRTLKDA